MFHCLVGMVVPTPAVPSWCQCYNFSIETDPFPSRVTRLDTFLIVGLLLEVNSSGEFIICSPKNGGSFGYFC